MTATTNNSAFSDPFDIAIIESRQVVQLRPDAIRVTERVSGGHVLVDGLSVGEIGSAVLRDRKHLARDGFLIAMVALNRVTGEVAGDPEILTRGFVYASEAEDLIEGAKERMREVLESQAGASGARNTIRSALQQYCFVRTGRRPLIVPLILEV